MGKITDEELIEELQLRFAEKKRSLNEHSQLLSSLKSVNSRLKESEKVKTQFLSNIRNEINNPLSALLALSKSITSSVKYDEDAVKTGAQLIHDELFSLDFQLRNIFMAAEIEAGETALLVSKVKLSGFFKNLIKDFSSIITKGKIDVSIEYKGINDETEFSTDSEKFYAIVSNLFHNALEYGGRGGKVTIKIVLKDQLLEVSIIDNGIGMCAADVNEIFNRFKQLETGTTKNYGGHGLGLSIVKALVDIVEGEIEVESELDMGTMFVVRISENANSGDINTISSDGNELLFDTGGYSEEEVF